MSTPSKTPDSNTDIFLANANKPGTRAPHDIANVRAKYDTSGCPNTKLRIEAMMPLCFCSPVCVLDFAHRSITVGGARHGAAPIRNTDYTYD